MGGNKLERVRKATLVLFVCYRPEMEPVRIFPTRLVNFKIMAGRPVSDRPSRPVFLQKVFVRCSMYLTKNFQKGGMGEVLKFVTLDGGLRKKLKKVLFFLQN